MADSGLKIGAMASRIGRVIIMAVVILSSLGSPLAVRAESTPPQPPTPPGGSEISGKVLSDGEFVNGPNVGDFDIRAYLQSTAPLLARFADDLYGRADYYSINPRVYLTLLEVHAHLISAPDPARIDNPFNLASSGFIAQIDELSNAMVSAYYLHLYSYSGAPGVFIKAPAIPSANGGALVVSSDMNAGTYGLLAGLALIEKRNEIPLLMDNSQADGFFQSYQRLFPGGDPTSESNHIYKPGDEGAASIPVDILQLQLPYLKGESWMFNGVHDAAGADVGDPLVNAAAIDFAPDWPPWGVDTSNMWVVASGSGTPTKMSGCSVRIAHGDGWETGYYHLDSIPTFSGWIGQNEKIGVIANNLPQAICTGGFSTGPHVHFTLRRNGAYVAIDGTPLSGWYIHSGRWNYDDDPNYMWMERFGVKKLAFQPLLSESPALITQIITGSAHTCALIASGTPRCWGQNTSGQLGDGTTTDRLNPVAVIGLSSGVAALAAGWNHTCALSKDGALQCWGNNSSGQLGDGTTTTRSVPASVNGFASSGAQFVSAGQLHTCLLTSSGGVKCWGDNSHGQLGDGTNTNRLMPVNVSGLGSGIKMVSAGGSHTCALTDAGAVKCWGDNSRGQLGDGTTTSRLTAVNVSGLTSGVRSISAGHNHTCALTNVGVLKCWGANGSGQLGDGSTTDHPEPVAVSGLSSGMVAILTGQKYSCALTATGTIKCWGANGSGQLGDGSNSGRLSPVDVTGLLSGVVTISTGSGEHTCALTSAGVAQCWGANAFGQLGDGTTTSHNSAVNVNGLTYTLQVTKAGNGSGKVTGVPAGISCGFYCSATFITGTSITLSAAAGTGSSFSGWSGEGCSGTGTCTVNMTAARTVTATFTLNTYSLSVSTTGSGSISSSPAGINCGTDCSERYNYGTRVTLTANPAAGWVFGSWGDRCLGDVATSCPVTVDADKSVSARFTNITYPLTVIKSGNGNGTVTSLPAGIDCGSTCSFAFGDHSLVNLTAVAATGTTFTGWSGGGCSGTGVCLVNMGNAVNVTATFTLKTFTLTVSKTGGGSISSSPAGISCGNDCSEVYNYGIRVTLTATPDSGYGFSSWGGRCLGESANVCTVVMDDNKSASANFTFGAYYLTISKTGSGSGTVSSSPAGIDCGATCTHGFDAGTLVTLSAVAAGGSTFSGWSGGGCSGNSTCMVTMSSSLSISAIFDQPPAAFTKSLPANGSVNQPVSVSLSWAASAGASAYWFCIDTSNDNACTNWVNNGTSISKLKGGLSQNTTYYWQVRAVNGAGTTYPDGSATSFWSFTTGTLPGAFGKISPASGALDLRLDPTISWAPSAGATSYWVCYDTSNDNQCSNWVNNGTSSNRLLSGLAQNTTYYWQVRAKNAIGVTYANGIASAYWNFKSGVKPASFGKTTPVNGATSQPLNLTLSWGTSKAATSYWVCYDTSNDNTCAGWIDNGSATSKTLSSLTAGTSYYWQVRAVNTIGTTYAEGSSTSYWSFTTQPAGGGPGAFNKLAPFNGSIGQPTMLSLSWGSSAGASAYFYCFDKTNDNTCTTWIGIGMGTSTTLSDLTPNTIYYWQVRAVNATGTTYANGASTTFWNFKIAQ